MSIKKEGRVSAAFFWLISWVRLEPVPPPAPTAAAAPTTAAASAVAAATTATAAAATTAARTFLTWLGFIDGQGAAAVLLAVQRGNRRLGLAVSAHLDESETLRPAGVPVGDDF